jgi:hypothetical protein
VNGRKNEPIFCSQIGRALSLCLYSSRLFDLVVCGLATAATAAEGECTSAIWNSSYNDESYSYPEFSYHISSLLSTRSHAGQISWYRVWRVFCPSPASSKIYAFTPRGMFIYYTRSDPDTTWYVTYRTSWWSWFCLRFPESRSPSENQILLEFLQSLYTILEYKRNTDCEILSESKSLPDGFLDLMSCHYMSSEVTILCTCIRALCRVCNSHLHGLDASYFCAVPRCSSTSQS